MVVRAHLGDLSTPATLGPLIDLNRFSKKRPQYFPRNNNVYMLTEADFHDSAYWRLLESKYLDRYVLPHWEDAPTEGGMLIWLERMGTTEREYVNSQHITLKDWIEMNPDWPLRAFIGEALELMEEDGQTNPR